MVIVTSIQSSDDRILHFPVATVSRRVQQFSQIHSDRLEVPTAVCSAANAPACELARVYPLLLKSHKANTFGF